MACGPERTAPTAPAGRRSGVWVPGLAGAGGGAAREHRAGPGLAAAPGGRGEGRSGLGVLPSSRSPGGALGLFSSYRGHRSLGVGERGGGEARGPPRASPAPSLASAAVLSSYMDGHGTMGGTRHRTQDWRSPCRRNHTGQGAGDAPPRGTCKRGGPADPRRRGLRPDKAQGQKQPLLSRGRSLDRPVHEREASWAGSGTVQATWTRADTNTDTGALGSEQDGPALGGQAPLGTGRGTPAPGREVCGCRGARQGAGVQKDMPAICRFESRCPRSVQPPDAAKGREPPPTLGTLHLSALSLNARAQHTRTQHTCTQHTHAHASPQD